MPTSCEKKIENYLLADLLSSFPFLNVYLNLFNTIMSLHIEINFVLTHVTKLLFHLFTCNLKVSLLCSDI